MFMLSGNLFCSILIVYRWESDIRKHIPIPTVNLGSVGNDV